MILGVIAIFLANSYNVNAAENIVTTIKNRNMAHNRVLSLKNLLKTKPSSPVINLPLKLIANG